MSFIIFATRVCGSLCHDVLELALDVVVVGGGVVDNVVPDIGANSVVLSLDRVHRVLLVPTKQ